MPLHNYPETSRGDSIWPRDVPPRPEAPVDYVPEPFHKIAPTNVLEQLMGEHQRGEAIPVHEVSRERLRSLSRRVSAASSSPTIDSHRSTSNFQSLTKATSRGVAKLGKAALGKTKKTLGGDKNGSGMGGLDSSARSSKRTSLYSKSVLPRLTIPDATKAAERSLNSACSTGTTSSPSWKIESMSPTSRELRGQLFENHPGDIVAELHRMISARRRVRKSRFGQEVHEYCQARPGWDDGYPPRDYCSKDIEQLRTIVAALQKQKDMAQDLVRRAPRRYR